MGKGDIFSKHGGCNKCESSTPYLLTNNLFSEYQSKNETQKAIARENLGIKDYINFKDLKGLVSDSHALKKAFQDNKIVIECNDGSIGITKKEVKLASGIVSTIYDLKLLKSVSPDSGGIQTGNLEFISGEGIQIEQSGDKVKISSGIDISVKEDKSNKVLSISKDSTNNQYPTALAVYNFLVEALSDSDINIKYAKTEDVANDVDSILYGG